MNLTALVCLGVAAFAQEVQVDYDRAANFSAYKTYQWMDYKPVPVGDQLLDQDIKRAVDEQLAGKGLGRLRAVGTYLSVTKHLSQTRSSSMRLDRASVVGVVPGGETWPISTGQLRLSKTAH
ncbi:MAG: DUF4136 domain-containing protein [Bryobacteraceae bacterium]